MGFKSSYWTDQISEGRNSARVLDSKISARGLNPRSASSVVNQVLLSGGRVHSCIFICSVWCRHRQSSILIIFQGWLDRGVE